MVEKGFGWGRFICGGLTVVEAARVEVAAGGGGEVGWRRLWLGVVRLEVVISGGWVVVSLLVAATGDGWRGWRRLWLGVVRLEVVIGGGDVALWSEEGVARERERARGRDR